MCVCVYNFFCIINKAMSLDTGRGKSIQYPKYPNPQPYPTDTTSYDKASFVYGGFVLFFGSFLLTCGFVPVGLNSSKNPQETATTQKPSLGLPITLGVIGIIITLYGIVSIVQRIQARDVREDIREPAFGLFICAVVGIVCGYFAGDAWYQELITKNIEVNRRNLEEPPFSDQSPSTRSFRDTSYTSEPSSVPSTPVPTPEVDEYDFLGVWRSKNSPTWYDLQERIQNRGFRGFMKNSNNTAFSQPILVNNLIQRTKNLNLVEMLDSQGKLISSFTYNPETRQLYDTLRQIYFERVVI